MENLVEACREFTTAALFAADHGVSKFQFFVLFDCANGFDPEEGNLSDVLPAVADPIRRRLSVGIQHLDGLCLEHRCDAFDEWSRQSITFGALNDN